jgi:hypothetical protein
MAELTTEQRERLKASDFAYVDRGGERHLPIHDEEHVRNAIQRFGQTHFESQAAKHDAARKIVRAAKKYGVEVADDDVVSRAAQGHG